MYIYAVDFLLQTQVRRDGDRHGANNPDAVTTKKPSSESSDKGVCRDELTIPQDSQKHQPSLFETLSTG